MVKTDRFVVQNGPFRNAIWTILKWCKDFSEIER